MKKKIIDEKNENGLYTKTTVKEKTPEDGFVYENKEHIATSWSETNHPTRSVWHKGYAKKFSYTTNDPRITRPFAYAMCGIFLAIGIICLLFHSWFFGIVFTAVALFTFYDSKKDIDAIEEDFIRDFQKETETFINPERQIKYEQELEYDDLEL